MGETCVQFCIFFFFLSVQEVRKGATPLRFMFHHMFLISTSEYTYKHTHTRHIWVRHYTFDFKFLTPCPSQLWCEGVREMPGVGSCPQMTSGLQGLWQTRRQVALGSHSRAWVSELCCTHKHKGHAHPEPGWVTKTMCSGTWLSTFCKLEMACFPEERNKNKIRKGRWQFQFQIACCFWNKGTLWFDWQNLRKEGYY